MSEQQNQSSDSIAYKLKEYLDTKTTLSDSQKSLLLLEFGHWWYKQLRTFGILKDEAFGNDILTPEELKNLSIKMPDLKYDPNFSNDEITKYQNLAEETIARELLKSNQSQPLGGGEPTRTKEAEWKEAKAAFEGLVSGIKSPKPKKPSNKN